MRRSQCLRFRSGAGLLHVQLQRCRVVLNCLLVLAHAVIRRPAVEVRICVGLVHLYHNRKVRNGIFVVLFFVVADSAIVIRVDVVRVQCEHAVVIRNRLIKLAHPSEAVSTVVERFHVVGVVFKALGVVLHSQIVHPDLALGKSSVVVRGRRARVQ